MLTRFGKRKTVWLVLVLSQENPRGCGNILGAGSGLKSSRDGKSVDHFEAGMAAWNAEIMGIL